MKQPALEAFGIALVWMFVGANFWVVMAVKTGFIYQLVGLAVGAGIALNLQWAAPNFVKNRGVVAGAFTFLSIVIGELLMTAYFTMPPPAMGLPAAWRFLFTGIGAVIEAYQPTLFVLGTVAGATGLAVYLSLPSAKNGRQ